MSICPVIEEGLQDFPRLLRHNGRHFRSSRAINHVQRLASTKSRTGKTTASSSLSAGQGRGEKVRYVSQVGNFSSRAGAYIRR